MSIKKAKSDETTSAHILYTDDNVTISRAHYSSKPFEQVSLFFKAYLDQLIKNVHWIQKGNHRWNLWTIASYAGVFDIDKWPLFSHVFVCYEDQAGESMIFGKNHQWVGYNVKSDVYGIDYVIAIHIILK